MGMALDDTCLYELLDCESLNGVAALHGYMIRGDFTSARRILDTTFKHNRRHIAYVLDEAIILWHEHNVEVSNYKMLNSLLMVASRAMIRDVLSPRSKSMPNAS